MILVFSPLYISFFIIPVLPHYTKMFWIITRERYFTRQGTEQSSILYPKNIDFSPWVTFLMINILCTAAMVLFSEWVSLTKASIYPSFAMSYSPKFVIASIFCWVVNPTVSLTKFVNTSGSSIVTADKTWCKLMARILLLSHLKRCTSVTSIILVIV